MKKSLWINKITKVQDKIVHSVLELLKGHEDKSCYYKIPTGMGKTVIGIRVALRFKKVLWVTYGTELLSETVSRISETLGKTGSVGLIQGQDQVSFGDITVASVKTLCNPEILNSIDRDLFDLIIFDEAHHIHSATWQTVFSYFRGKKLGQTATSVRGDGVDIANYFGPCAFNVDYFEAAKESYIAEGKTVLIVTKSKKSGVQVGDKKFTPKKVDTLVISRERVEIILDSFKKYTKGLPYIKAICFCPSVQYAQFMTEEFRNNSIKSEFLVADTRVQTKKERLEIYTKFKNTKDIQVLCVVDILNEGKDIPDCNVGLFVRGTISPVVRVQQPGRLTRIHEGKSSYLGLYYFDVKDSSPVIHYRAFDRYSLRTIVDFDYYDGDDPYELQQLKDSFFLDYDAYHNKYTWSRENIIGAIRDFHKLTGKIRVSDFRAVNKLPSEKAVRVHFPSVGQAIKSAGIAYNENYTRDNSEWTKQACTEEILKYHEKTKKLSVDELGSNGLPPRSMVEKFWGSWTACREELGLKNRMFQWDKKSCLEALQDFKKKYGKKATSKNLGTGQGLPSKDKLMTLWGSLLELNKQHPDLFFARETRNVHKFIYQRGPKSFRVQITLHKAGGGTIKHNMGTFKTIESAMSARNKKLVEVGYAGKI